MAYQVIWTDSYGARCVKECSTVGDMKSLYYMLRRKGVQVYVYQLISSPGEV